MPASRWGAYPARFVHAGGNLDLTQIGGYQVNLGVNTQLVQPAGSVYPRAAYTMFGAPAFTVTTRDLVTVFGTVSAVAGLACTGGGELYYQQRASAGIFAGGSTFAKLDSTNGFLYPQTLNASQDGRATLDLMYVPLYDGTNQPVTAAIDQASAGAAPAFNSEFSLGPVYADSEATETQLLDVTNVTLDFGMDFRATRADGKPFADFGAIYSQQPTVTLTFLNMEMLGVATEAGFTSMFGEGWVNSLAIYLHRCVDEGIRGADGTLFKFSLVDGIWNPSNVSVQEEADGTVNVIIRPTYDGTNAMIQVSTAALLPA